MPIKKPKQGADSPRLVEPCPPPPGAGPVGRESSHYKAGESIHTEERKAPTNEERRVFRKGDDIPMGGSLHTKSDTTFLKIRGPTH
ncbi:uncharacterized protein PgNI_00685 [Pyricularia grisea]|uniref:Uncharacterized protein n=1 Tax=Pyricularia grisea TaxID=148305 RepID=A0A6P8BIM5_PYRGI|nr:uncharacterized protein PgNI_00685 [Pyricularia grisea]TLD16623.1 hypothetical protein PgNI_00685 [Pyricularia grisea]